MTTQGGLPISSCWVATEGLIGLANQARGLAQALGVPYIFKEVKKRQWWQMVGPVHDFQPPWPDVLITCGRQGAAVSTDIRRASGGKTFTIHIQDPLGDPRNFDCVIAPAHDKLSGENVFITQGATHHVTKEKLMAGAEYFYPLLSHLPRPIISVLIGGKNKHQGFTQELAKDISAKLLEAQHASHGSLAVSFSRRTGAENEAIIRNQLSGAPAYIWDGISENPYFGFLSLAETIVVTSDSISMLSEACSTGKPVYIYELPFAGGRHQEFVNSLFKMGVARPFKGRVENFSYTPLDETRKAADFVRERFLVRRPDLKLNAIR